MTTQEPIVEKESKLITLWSIKLKTGQHLISELYDAEYTQETLMMVNPLIIEILNTNNGEMTTARPYDVTTDEEIFEIQPNQFVSKPQTVNEFYREFYVKALMFNYVKEARKSFERNAISNPLNAVLESTEMEKYLATVSVFLEERFGIELNVNTSAEHFHMPASRTLH